MFVFKGSFLVASAHVFRYRGEGRAKEGRRRHQYPLSAVLREREREKSWGLGGFYFFFLCSYSRWDGLDWVWSEGV